MIGSNCASLQNIVEIYIISQIGLKKMRKNVGTSERYFFLLFAAAENIPFKKNNKQEDYIMTMRNKQELIRQVITLLNAMIEVEELPPTQPPPSNEQVEMLTIKECAQQISGLSEHTVRQLVLQNKLPHIRTGQGKRGKILVPKSALLEYFRLAA